MQYVSDIDNQPLAYKVSQVNNWNQLLGLTPLFGNIHYLTPLNLGIMVICVYETLFLSRRSDQLTADGAQI